MSFPLVFKGREEEMTMEELEAMSVAAKVKSTEQGTDNDDEEISLVKSDITNSPAPDTQSAITAAKKRKAGRPPKKTNATKKLKQAVNSKATVEPSSAANSSSSSYGTPEAPSSAPSSTGNLSHTAIPTGVDSDKRDDEVDVKDDAKNGASPEPASAPKRRGRPRKTQALVPNSTADQGKRIETKSRATSARVLMLLAKRQAKTNHHGLIDSARTTRAASRNGLMKPVSAKTTPAKKVPTTHGRGVGRPKKTPPKGKSIAPQFTDEEYVVEKIVDSRIDPATKEQMYMVKWKGYAAKDNTWEPKKNLRKCGAMIKTFNNSPNAKGKK
ncbi:Chromobox -like protein 3 [Colletotrichum tanaceti]|uniref:Chromobox-like protein 3 n=1 Tax=Colletotrichum tanaceti TaxID=1306861 RepID=A0A4U6XV20_9PEZI|nr:Chromobox -like protein 3 [Colletotrichum tanaceti]TKW59778.1 Chromobox -like protein 3 [Colletotrichum tanaceti]